MGSAKFGRGADGVLAVFLGEIITGGQTEMFLEVYLDIMLADHILVGRMCFVLSNLLIGTPLRAPIKMFGNGPQ